MESERSGEYIALVARLQKAVDDTWCVSVDDASMAQTLPLVPMTCVVRLWQSYETGTLRGTIRLEGTEHWAPFQSNEQLGDLIRAWLSPEQRAGEE